jgi:tetratricopeptide (TPR) repeat protein
LGDSPKLKYLVYSFGFLLLIAFFFITTQSIISARIMDLKVRIQKDQIMNYELSSKTLRDKIKQVYQDRDNFKEEMRLNVLESNVLNAGIEEWNPGLSASEEFGFSVLNLVRAFTFKPPIRMVNDRQTLIKIQYAFYQERKRKFAIAHEYYNDLEESLDGNSEELAFVLLHSAFCLAMIDKGDESIEKLDSIMSKYSGTHYSDNAIFLKRLIMESKQKKNSISQKNLSYTEKIEYYYNNGNYEDILSMAGDKENLIPKHRYMVSRSKEESGKIQEAIRTYIQLTGQKQDSGVAIQANRRLLLLGNFYSQQESLVNFSKKKSEELGDKDSFALLEEGTKLMKNPKILNVLEKETDIDKPLEKSSDLVIEKEIDDIIAEEMNQIDQENQNIKIQIELKDGRTLLARSIVFQSGFMEIQMNAFPMRTPISNFKSIHLYNERLKTKPNKNLKIKTELGVFSASKLTQSDRGIEAITEPAMKTLNAKSIISIDF